MDHITDLDAQWLMGLVHREADNTAAYTDLQLAAELGKTLLERNKELELTLKQQQNLIEDKSLEIEYLNKQTYELREVNESRWKLYEQLEYSIQDLERENRELKNDHKNEKKLSRSLKESLEKFEEKCTDLQVHIDQLQFQLQLKVKSIQELIRDQERLQDDNSKLLEENNAIRKQQSLRQSAKHSNVSHDTVQLQTSTSNTLSETEDRFSKTCQKSHESLKDEKITELEDQLRDLKVKRSRDFRKIEELDEHIGTLIEENRTLQHQLNELYKKDDDIKTLSDEIFSLDVVKKGLVCSRCFSSNIDYNHPPLHESTSRQDSSVDSDAQNDSINKDNPYKDLVDKYEAIRESQKQSPNNIAENKKSKTNTNDLSDTETTASSGFSEDTAHKSTQTDNRPGSFLFSVDSGENYKFSIYDDTGPLENRFRDSPKYKELFKEIFAVLKKAAERKQDGETLPLLDDKTPVVAIEPKVPPVTPAAEIMTMANIFEDNTVDKDQIPIAEDPVAAVVDECVRKKVSRRHRRRQNSQGHGHSRNNSITQTPNLTPSGSPKMNKTSRSRSQFRRNRRKFLPLSIECAVHLGDKNDGGNNMANQQQVNWEYPTSAAISNLHMLQKLDHTYAEVLKKALCNYRGHEKLKEVGYSYNAPSN